MRGQLARRSLDLADQWPLRLLAERRADPAGALVGLDRARELGRPWLRNEMAGAGLRGRGGASFPVVRKWDSVAAAPGPRFVLANGEEGEPASWKDRYLLRYRPEQVVEGVALAALAVDASEAWIYTSDPESVRTVTAAVSVLQSRLGALTVQCIGVPPSYVAGEETAAISFINGGAALPTSKPPRPHEAGIRGQPTLVGNVETMAHIAWIARQGASAFRRVGPANSPGTFLACVSGAVHEPVLWEIPVGTSIAEIVAAASPVEEPRGVLLGGYFSGFLPRPLLETAADPDALSDLGFGLGNGSMVVVGESACPVGVVADLLAFFAAETAGQCGPCVRGTAAMRDIADGLMRGDTRAAELERLRGHGVALRGRGVCQLLDAAALTASRAFSHYEAELQRHLDERCETCAGRRPDPSGGYAVDVEAMLARAVVEIDGRLDDTKVPI